MSLLNPSESDAPSSSRLAFVASCGIGLALGIGALAMNVATYSSRGGTSGQGRNASIWLIEISPFVTLACLVASVFPPVRRWALLLACALVSLQVGFWGAMALGVSALLLFIAV